MLLPLVRVGHTHQNWLTIGAAEVVSNKQFALLGVFLPVGVLPLFGMQWPIITAKNTNIESAFGIHLVG